MLVHGVAMVLDSNHVLPRALGERREPWRKRDKGPMASRSPAAIPLLPTAPFTPSLSSM